MQRLFSAFPDGRPGAGLLLLRLGLSLALAMESRVWLDAATPTTWQSEVIAFLAVIVAGSLLLGFMTPIAGVIAILSLSFHATPSMAYVFVIAIAVLLLGPGAFSVDARLFGRREIVISEP